MSKGQANANDDAMAQESRKQRYFLLGMLTKADYYFCCSVCMTLFPVESDLMSHFQSLHVNNGEEQSKSGQLQAQTEGQSQITAAGQGLKSKPRFHCSLCPKTFASHKTRLAHINHVHLGRGHPCPVPGCGHVARYASHLQTHIVKHSKQRPFACDRCPKAFKTGRDLEKHVILVHPQLGQ